MELPKEIKEILNECGFLIRYQQGSYIDFVIYSPKGERIVVSSNYDGTKESIINAFTRENNNFDVEEHTEKWIKSIEDKRTGTQGLPYCLPNDFKNMLSEDSKWIKNSFLGVIKALGEK